MRISNHRYSRDRSRYDLAYGMLQLGARPKTVTAWTQLTQYQIRNVADEYGELLARHRGRPPKSIAWFWRERRRQQEGAILASLLVLTKVVPRKAARDEDYPWRSVSSGMRVCAVYQDYARTVPRPTISFEYALLLVKELVRGEVVTLSRCSECKGAMLADPLSAPPHICTSCRVQRRHELKTDDGRNPDQHQGGRSKPSQKNEHREIRQQVSLLFD